MDKYEKSVQTLVKNIEDGKRVTPLKAIRARCLDCCCFSPMEVKKCPAKDCPLWAFRMGKNTTGE